MNQGIAILGLNGAGKSTLAHSLAKVIDYFEIDVEDYYFPGQKSSRIWAIDNKTESNPSLSGDLPFSKPKTKFEVQSMILKDIKAYPKFILSGVSLNWNMEICSHIKSIFLIDVPLAERLKRIKKREEIRFGSRVLPGGDMYFQQQEFLKTVTNRKLNDIKESIKKHFCQFARLDGMLPVEENLEKILNYFNE